MLVVMAVLWGGWCGVAGVCFRRVCVLYGCRLLYILDVAVECVS